MEALLKQLLDNINHMKENLEQIDQAIQNLDQRLFRLEKVDSIEHRVAVNQIDLSDIKEIVEKVEEFQREKILPMTKKIEEFHRREDIEFINKRLDAHLIKIAQNEEAILMLKGNPKQENL
jgi:molecular chaperone DnaK (HSP70)